MPERRGAIRPKAAVDIRAKTRHWAFAQRLAACSDNNTVLLNNSTFAGTFGDNGILIDNENNTLNGAGNTAANATFPAGNLCQDNDFAWTGTVIFDGVAITNANCP